MDVEMNGACMWQVQDRGNGLTYRWIAKTPWEALKGVYSLGGGDDLDGYEVRLVTNDLDVRHIVVPIDEDVERYTISLREHFEQGYGYGYFSGGVA